MPGAVEKREHHADAHHDQLGCRKQVGQPVHASNLTENHGCGERLAKQQKQGQGMRAFRYLVGLMLALAWANAALAAGAILPPGKQTFVDANGAPLVAGTINFYIPSTTTPKSTWQDQAQTTLNTNPVVLDGRGQASIYGSGSYREVVKDWLGNLIWDQQVQAPALDDLSNVSGIAAPYGSIGGLTLSTAGSSANFAVAKGGATDSTGATPIILSSAMTKTTGSWVAGTGNGGLDTGTIANSTWYHAYLIKRVDTGAVDVLVSTNPTTPTLPTNYTLFRRIGSMKTDGSAHWVAFSQFGDEFIWVTPVTDISGGAIGLTPNGIALASVPTGIKVQANLSVNASNASSAVGVNIADDAQSGMSSGAALFVFQTSGAGLGNGVQVRAWTNTAAAVLAVASAAPTTLNVGTRGWIDRRGRDD